MNSNHIPAMTSIEDINYLCQWAFRHAIDINDPWTSEAVRGVILRNVDRLDSVWVLRDLAKLSFKQAFDLEADGESSEADKWDAFGKKLKKIAATRIEHLTADI